MCHLMLSYAVDTHLDNTFDDVSHHNWLFCFLSFEVNISGDTMFLEPSAAELLHV